MDSCEKEPECPLFYEIFVNPVFVKRDGVRQIITGKPFGITGEANIHDIHHVIGVLMDCTLFDFVIRPWFEFGHFPLFIVVPFVLTDVDDSIFCSHYQEFPVGTFKN